MYLHKEYHKHPLLNDGTEIKMAISYNKDLKAYRVCCIPVKRSKLEGRFTMEESGSFTGFNDTLIKFDRQSEKRLNLAKEVLKANTEKYLQYFTKSEAEQDYKNL